MDEGKLLEELHPLLPAEGITGVSIFEGVAVAYTRQTQLAVPSAVKLGDGTEIVVDVFRW